MTIIGFTDRRLRKVPKWVRNGRHSGYPWCCVAYFCLRSLLLPRAYFDWRVAHLTPRPVEHQYIRCWRCWWRNRWVSQHLCDERCPPCR